MQNIIAFFVAIKTSFFNQLNAAEQALAVLAVATPALTILWVIRNFYLGRNKNLAVELAEEKEAAQKWLKKFNEASGRLADAEAELPSGWLKDMEKERRDGNEERAIGRLRDSFRAAGRDLAKAADELVDYHLSVGFDLGPKHFIEARRYGRLAVLHGGATPERDRRLDELETLCESAPGEGVFESWEDLQAAFPTGPEALTAIRLLNNETVRWVREGQYGGAWSINQRALRLARRLGLPPSDLFLLTCRYRTADLLDRLGRYTEALAEIDAFSPDQTKALPTGHPDRFATQWLRASVLYRLGRYSEAMAEVDEYAPEQALALPANHPDIFATRVLRAGVLVSLDRNAEALDEIDSFLPFQNKALPAGDTDLFITRHLRATVLHHLGRHDEALKEIEALASDQAKFLPAGHPERFALNWLRARIFDDTDLHNKALSEVAAFAPEQVNALPAGHPDLLRTEWLKARILHHLKRSSEALTLIEPIIESQMVSLGISHKWTKDTLALRDEITAGLANPRSSAAAS